MVDWMICIISNQLIMNLWSSTESGAIVGSKSTQPCWLTPGCVVCLIAHSMRILLHGLGLV